MCLSAGQNGTCLIKMAGGSNHWHDCSAFSNVLHNVLSKLESDKIKKLTKESFFNNCDLAPHCPCCAPLPVREEIGLQPHSKIMLNNSLHRILTCTCNFFRGFSFLSPFFVCQELNLFYQPGNADQKWTENKTMLYTFCSLIGNSW